MGITLITALLGAVAVIAFFAGVYATVEQSDSVPDRLQVYAATVRERESTGRRKSGLAPLLSRLDRLLSGQNMARRLALMLAQANVQMTLPEFLMVEGAATVVGGVIGLMYKGYFISALAGAALGLAGPYLYFQRKRQKRIEAFHGQLVDVLSLIVGSLRGGHALTTALDLVSKELSPPASEEFGRVLREIGFGLTQTEALNNLVTRMESDDLQLVVTAVNISHEVGGSLSEVLEKITETIRERIRLQGEIRVLTTQQRLTTYLLVALPIVLVILLSLINPTWMMRLFAPGWVRIIPATALIMEIVGFLISQRLTRIEV